MPAIWDRRNEKQILIERYSARLTLLRPLINVHAKLVGRPLLPPRGSQLAQGFVSCLNGDSDGLLDVLADLKCDAAEKGLSSLVLGLDVRDPRLPMLQRHLRARSYRTRIYLVSWPGEPAEPPDGRLLYPEVATL